MRVLCSMSWGYPRTSLAVDGGTGCGLVEGGRRGMVWVPVHRIRSSQHLGWGIRGAGVGLEMRGEARRRRRGARLLLSRLRLIADVGETGW